MANHVIIHNQYSLQKIKQVIGNKNHYSIIQQGGYPELVDEKVTAEQAKFQLGFNSSTNYLLFFGQIKTAKRLDVLIKSMKYVKGDVKLVVAGRPWKDDFSKYDQLVSELELEERVEKFIRFVTDEERELLMKACDVMVLPYEEVYQSAALLMAMSYGLAIITSDLDSFKEVIRQGENGIMFRSLDEEDLSDKINSLINNSEMLSQLQQGALRSIANEFSWSNTALQYKKRLNL